MQDYYEILDAEYWTERQQAKLRDEERIETNNDSIEIFRVVSLMGLGFLFWALSEWPGIKFGRTLNLIGWFFALWSFITVISPRFQKNMT
ncbi:MAG TPA: hypothetical protein VGQ87_00585 [Patescibacteria group bacterium]|nr:hypothetical protein [Patescibacteria group bacterium]